LSLWELNAGELLARTASGDPTPGGGSVATMTGALGLGLVCMALEVSARRRSAAAEVTALLAEARTFLERLKAHPDADVAAFEAYMASLALPKADDAQRAERARATGKAALGATQVPLAAARDLLGALHLAERAAGVAHRSIVSDVGAGAFLLGAAVQATLLNVDINLSSLPPGARDSALNERTELAAESLNLAAQVAHTVSLRLRPAG
jgi:formiminotetrahydrofolate cyclodeaminase